jgi:hypothetical protein
MPVTNVRNQIAPNCCVNNISLIGDHFSDHVLLEATSDGHCALPLPNLKRAAVKLLEAPETSLEQALAQMLASGSLLLEEIEPAGRLFAAPAAKS